MGRHSHHHDCLTVAVTKGQPLVVRSADGRNYVCPLEPTVVIPDGCIVQAHWNGSTLDGVRVIRLPGNVQVHACGVQTGLTGKWVGQS